MPRTALLVLSTTLLAVVTLSLSGCGDNPAGPFDHHRPAEGTRYVYEQRQEILDIGDSATYIHELYLEHEDEWNGYRDVHRFVEENAPGGDHILMFFDNLHYLANGDLRFISDELQDTIYSFDYPFGGGSDTVRTVVDTDDESAWHAATYEGEESIEVDGTTYTARVVKDYLIAGGDGHPGFAFILDATIYYVPELGVAPFLRFEMWSPDDFGARDELLMIDTYTLLRIEE